MLVHGGCQCGAVRFAAKAEGTGVEFCHCAMCRRAVGNIFMSSLSVRKADLRWDGEPKTYASSPIATRGFCGACGTPVYFSYNESARIDLMAGAIDEAAALHPEQHFGVESRLPHFSAFEGLPEMRTGDAQQIVDRWTDATGGFPG